MTTPPAPKPRRAWILGVLGLALFVTAIGSTLRAGALAGETHDLLAGYASFARERYHQVLCEGVHADAFCDDTGVPDLPRLPDCRGRERPPECVALYSVALSAIAESAPASTSFRLLGVWDSVSGWGARLLGPFTPRAADLADRASLSLVPLFVCAMVGLALVFVALGFASVGVWAGALINEQQQRVSLSLVQIVAWTIVLVAAYSVLASFNVGLLAEASLRASAAPMSSYFPMMPAWAWAALGITVATQFAASLIKNQKPDSGKRMVSGTALPKQIGVVLAPLERRRSPSEASFADLVFGEDKHDHGRLDVTRAQNVLFTIMLLMTYIGYLVAMMEDLSPSTLLGPFPTAEALFTSLPDPGPTFAALLGVTHSTYLAGKFQPAGEVPAGKVKEADGADTAPTDAER